MVYTSLNLPMRPSKWQPLPYIEVAQIWFPFLISSRHTQTNIQTYTNTSTETVISLTSISRWIQAYKKRTCGMFSICCISEVIIDSRASTLKVLSWCVRLEEQFTCTCQCWWCPCHILDIFIWLICVDNVRRAIGYGWTISC